MIRNHRTDLYTLPLLNRKAIGIEAVMTLAALVGHLKRNGKCDADVEALIVVEKQSAWTGYTPDQLSRALIAGRRALGEGQRRGRPPKR